MFENSMQMPSTIILIDKHTLFQFINAARKQRGIWWTQIPTGRVDKVEYR